MSNPHKPSHRRSVFTRLRSLTCFAPTSYTRLDSPTSTSFSTDYLPLLLEKDSSIRPSNHRRTTSSNPTHNPFSDPSTPRTRSKSTTKTLPPSPPRLTRWPSSHKLTPYRNTITVPEYQNVGVPPPDERTDISTRSRAGSTPETGLVDELNWIDPTYHQQRKQEKKEEKRDLCRETGLRRDLGMQAGISIERSEDTDEEISGYGTAADMRI